MVDMVVKRWFEVNGSAGFLLNCMESDESVCTIDSWHKQALGMERPTIRR